MVPETEIINPLAPKPTWFCHANTVILHRAQKPKLWAAEATWRGADFQQRVHGSTVHGNHSVNQSAAKPKHTQQTEQNRKLTDRRKCLIRLFLAWRGLCTHCNNILTTRGSNIAVISFPIHVAAYFWNKAKQNVRIPVWTHLKKETLKQNPNAGRAQRHLSL